MDKKTRTLAITALGMSATAAAGMILVYKPYRRDIKIARRRLAQIEHKSSYTACGKVEYAERGAGNPVLVVHGAAGGYDQGLYIAEQHLDGDFRVIAPSRYGYLGASIPPGANPKTQANAFVCLLEELGIEQAAVLAVSAGGPSAVQLALHYPDRVSALILTSTAISDRRLELPPKDVVQPIIGSNFIMWLLTHPLHALGQRMFIPDTYTLTPAQGKTVAAFMHRLLPVAPRKDGMIFDMYVTNVDPSRRPGAYPLEEIEIPTLIVNAMDDPLAKFEDAQAMSERIPHSRFVTLEDGGHIMLGHGDRVRREVSDFVRANA